MSEESVVVFLRAQIGEFTAKMREASGEAENLGSHSSKMSHVAGVGLLALGGVASSIGVASVHMADTFELSHARMLTAIKNTGGSYAQLTPRISAVDSMMEKFGFTNSQTQDSIATLTSATHSASKAIDLQALAANIAAGRHIDLSTATSILAKVETGHVALLGRLGIQTKDATGHTISQTEAIKRLSEMFHGQAAAAADTFAGKQAALKAELTDVGVKIGLVLIPILEKLANFLVSTVVPAVGKVVGYVQEHWPRVQKTIVDVMGHIRDGISRVVAVIESLWQRFGSTIVHYVTSTWGNVVKYISGALEVVKGVFAFFSDFFQGHWSKLWGDVTQIVGGAWKAISALLSQAWLQIKAIFATVWNAIKDGVHAAWSGIVSFLAGLPGKIFGFFAGLPGQFLKLGGDIVHAIVQGIKDAAGAVGDALHSMLSHIPGASLASYLPVIGGLFRAEGGPVSALMPYIVGERGPELFVPDVGGRIVPHAALAGSLEVAKAHTLGRPFAGGSGGAIMFAPQIQVSVDVAGTSATADEIRTAVEHGVRHGGEHLVDGLLDFQRRGGGSVAAILDRG